MYNGYMRRKVLEKSFDEALYGIFGGETERSEYVGRIFGEIGPRILTVIVVCYEVMSGRLTMDRARGWHAGLWRFQSRDRKLWGVTSRHVVEKPLREKGIKVEHI